MFISLQTRKSKYLRNLELGALIVAIVEIYRLKINIWYAIYLQIV